MGRHRALAGVALLSVAAMQIGVGSGVSRAYATAPGPYRGAVLFRPDGVLRSSPATVHQPSFGRAAFVTGTDGGLWWSSDRSGWLALGSPPAMVVVGAPAAVSWGDGRIDVFVRGSDNRLWQRWTSCGGCAWSGWLKPVGNDGTLASSPTATSWGPGRIDVFVTGSDGGVYQRFWDTSSWNPGWLPHGGVALGRPGAASWGPGRIDVFVKGLDNRLWQRFSDGSGWSGWFQPAGTEQGLLASAPSPALWSLGSRNRLTVFVQGIDNRLYQATWDGGWAAWTVVGAPNDVILGSPGVAGTLQFAPSVLARGTDDRVYLFYPDDPLGTALADFVAARGDNVTAAVYDITTGQTFTFGPGVIEHTASTVKVDILATLLAQAQAAGRGLTAEEQSLAVPMIEQSLDSAASALWSRLGPGAIGAFERAAGLTQTFPATNGI
ncbi:MAG: hypothetical protein M3256_19190, partial [Actinomycetota bacterium]|nr:hypothetical protein [Actinomycetota bacterium]